MQLTKKCQEMLTAWTHLKRRLISHSACQKMPEHPHILATFSKETLSAIQLARTCQNTLTIWTQKKPHQPSSLPEHARTHLQSGHRRSLISHPAYQKRPEHTHSLDTLSEGALLAIQLARRCQKTLTFWTHFQKGPH